ncbi:hypothetical protein [Candidatus Odyssella thessalonicensis]|uniref:hypothetical protein n=1 Tax=Candidatus Odyssella thessalonicensis TaxID=84647 RepID=UPI0003193E37|nr:hypothetical protein [Candidatus Odyssella thessalonicensis]
MTSLKKLVKLKAYLLSFALGSTSLFAMEKDDDLPKQPPLKRSRLSEEDVEKETKAGILASLAEHVSDFSQTSSTSATTLPSVPIRIETDSSDTSDLTETLLPSSSALEMIQPTDAPQVHSENPNFALVMSLIKECGLEPPQGEALNLMRQGNYIYFLTQGHIKDLSNFNPGMWESFKRAFRDNKGKRETFASLYFLIHALHYHRIQILPNCTAEILMHILKSCSTNAYLTPQARYRAKEYLEKVNQKQRLRSPLSLPFAFFLNACSGSRQPSQSPAPVPSHSPRPTRPGEMNARTGAAPTPSHAPRPILTREMNARTEAATSPSTSAMGTPRPLSITTQPSQSSETIPTPQRYPLNEFGSSFTKLFFPADTANCVVTTSLENVPHMTPLGFETAYVEFRAYLAKDKEKIDQHPTIIFNHFNTCSTDQELTEATRILANFRKGQMFCTGFKGDLKSDQVFNIFRQFSNASLLPPFYEFYGKLYQGYMRLLHLTNRITDAEACQIFKEIAATQSLLPSGLQELKLSSALYLAKMHYKNRTEASITTQEVMNLLVNNYDQLKISKMLSYQINKMIIKLKSSAQ